MSCISGSQRRGLNPRFLSHEASKAILWVRAYSDAGGKNPIDWDLRGDEFQSGLAAADRVDREVSIQRCQFAAVVCRES
jgi:hypothetical protein